MNARDLRPIRTPWQIYGSQLALLWARQAAGQPHRDYKPLGEIPVPLTGPEIRADTRLAADMLRFNAYRTN